MGYELKHQPSTDFSLISKYICHTFNLNQLEFSRELQISTSSSNRLINGKAKPSSDIVDRLTRFFFVALNHNFQQRGMRIRSDLSQMDLSTELQQLGLNPDLISELQTEFQQDCVTTDGAEFWLSAALIGFSYLMLNTSQITVPDTLSTFNVDRHP